MVLDIVLGIHPVIEYLALEGGDSVGLESLSPFYSTSTVESPRKALWRDRV